jgi:hypothetical protein
MNQKLLPCLRIRLERGFCILRKMSLLSVPIVGTVITDNGSSATQVAEVSPLVGELSATNTRVDWQSITRSGRVDGD